MARKQRRANGGEKPIQRPMKAGPGIICKPHRERMGVAVQAHLVINGEGFCKKCWFGQGTHALPVFLLPRRLQPRSPRIPAHPTTLQTIEHLRKRQASREKPNGQVPARPPVKRTVFNLGIRALAIAKAYPHQKERGQPDPAHEAARGKVSFNYVARARVVLHHNPALAEEVSRSQISLERAYCIAREERRAAPCATMPELVGTRCQKLLQLAVAFPGARDRKDKRRGIAETLKAIGACRRYFGQARLLWRRRPDLAERVLKGEIGIPEATSIYRRDLKATIPAIAEGVSTAAPSGTAQERSSDFLLTRC
jgi:hypothetical protein